jgi:hypothetical protein
MFFIYYFLFSDDRATATQLLTHPFVAGWQNGVAVLVDWLRGSGSGSGSTVAGSVAGGTVAGSGTL